MSCHTKASGYMCRLGVVNFKFGCDYELSWKIYKKNITYSKNKTNDNNILLRCLWTCRAVGALGAHGSLHFVLR